MNRPDPIDVLNRLLRLVYRSLPVYLAGGQIGDGPQSPWQTEAAPSFPPTVWSRDREAPGLAVLQTIAADRRRLATRLAAAIDQRDGTPETGRFPQLFTAMNDLSLDYILDRVGREQQEQIPVLRRSLAELEGDPEAHALAAEILANACKHGEMLEGLKSVPASLPAPFGKEPA